jgi:hypothetical protein
MAAWLVSDINAGGDILRNTKPALYCRAAYNGCISRTFGSSSRLHFIEQWRNEVYPCGGN